MFFNKMERGKHVINLARKVVSWLKPFSEKIEIAGSIRRGKKDPRDIDIVLIPKTEKDKEKIKALLDTNGVFLQGGDKKIRVRIERIKVELYYTNKDSWGATLLAYSGKKGSNIGLRIIARLKGFKLNQYGLFRVRNDERVAGKTEREIYSALHREYKEPWER